MKKLSLFISALFISCASFAFTTIVGATSGCSGTPAYFYLTDSTYTGGVWTSSNTAVATIGSTDGVLAALSAGTTIVSYTLGGSYATSVFIVNPSPAAISGVPNICVGSSGLFTDATTGGTWSSDYTYVASVGSLSGDVTGNHNGTANIVYTMPGGCSASYSVLVGPSDPGWIGGDSATCAGSSFTLTESVSGGTWSSGDLSIATVGLTTGLVSGVAAGTANITYTVSGTCGSSFTYETIVVSTTTDAGTISGGTSVYMTLTSGLSETVYGGTWSSSNTAIATVDPSTGVVTGVALGTATIIYSVSGCGGVANTSIVVTVVPLNSISGWVSFSGGFSGWVKVWLITYNTGTLNLEAYDSTEFYNYGDDSVFYQFLGEPTDSYRIKASVNIDTIITTTGFIPTYHTSNFYWHDASVLYHTTGTSDTYQDITMAYGLVAPGPGFISGNVTTGANRGTSGSAPAVGLLMEAATASGRLVQQTVTDASGNYSFSNLELGTYFVHPEAINYVSTDYTGITLTSGTPSVTATNFIQHTISHTITPISTGINSVNPSASAIVAYPNPTSGNLNIQWQESGNETGSVSISDITGREIYKTTIKMTSGKGSSVIDLSGLVNGFYIISIKSGDINYNNKIQVRH